MDNIEEIIQLKERIMEIEPELNWGEKAIAQLIEKYKDEIMSYKNSNGDSNIDKNSYGELKKLFNNQDFVELISKKYIGDAIYQYLLDKAVKSKNQLNGSNNDKIKLHYANIKEYLNLCSEISSFPNNVIQEIPKAVKMYISFMISEIMKENGITSYEIAKKQLKEKINSEISSLNLKNGKKLIENIGEIIDSYKLGEKQGEDRD